MSSSTSHATVTYTSMSIDDDVPSWGILLMNAYESDLEVPEVALQSLYQAPLSPAYASVYLEYLAPSDYDLEPVEAQPLPASVSPTALLPDYSVESEVVEEDPEEEPEEDPEEDCSDNQSLERELDLLLYLIGLRLGRVQQPLLLDSPGLLWPRTHRMAELYYELVYHPLRGRDNIIIDKIRVLHQQRQHDADMLTRRIQRGKAREGARDPERHDGPADASSSF
nr:hypothetical protein [Tanacetum cinerariifolium]